MGNSIRAFLGFSILGRLSFWVIMLVVAVTALAFRSMGMPGVIVVVSGFLGAVVLGYILVFRPELIFVIWIFAMSSVQFMGMLRLPGIPDFSFPRMFLMMVMFLIVFGMLSGRPILTRPVLPDVLIIAQTVYVLINLKLIGNPEYFHLWYNSSLAPLVAYIYAKQAIKTDKQIRLLCFSFVIILAYFAIVSFGEHFEIPALVWPRNIMDRSLMMPYFGRSRGPFFQPGIFGMMIGMFFIVNIFVLTRKHSRMVTVLLWTNLVLSGLGLLYTYTRGGWVATIMGVVFLSVFRPKFRKLVLVGVFLGLIVSIAGVTSSNKDDVLAKRLENTGTIENRLGFLASATRMIRINPLFGIGYFRYMELEYLYNKGTYIPLYGFVRKELGAGVPIHDIYIGRAAEEGLLSLGLFLWFLLEVARAFWRKWRMRPHGSWFDRDALAAFGAIVIVYLLGGMVEDFRYFDNVNVIAMFFAGIIVGYPVRREVGAQTVVKTKGSGHVEVI